MLTDSFMADLNTALRLVAEKHNVSTKLDFSPRGGAGSTRFDLTVSPIIKTASGEQISGDEQAWRSCATAYGLLPEWFGATYRARDGAYKITGIAPNRHKNCVLIRRVHDNKPFVTSPANVRLRMGFQAQSLG